MSVISFHDIGTDMVIRVSQDSSDCAPWQTVFRRVAGRLNGLKGKCPAFKPEDHNGRWISSPN
jgi:hypothetical protein